MKAIGGFFVAAVLAAALIVLPGGGTAAGQEGGKDTLTIGMVQGIDSMNPVRGVTVAAFEAYNMTLPTLTDKAAKDFATIPGLATEWKGSEDGKTWTYTLRPDMKWSDGQPLTAEDVAYTVNRSREEAWLNHSATTGNLTAKVNSPTELVITSKVPDPKLPAMDVYVVPKHIYEQYDDKAITKWNGQTDVAGGAFSLTEFKKGQFARFTANPEYWNGKPSVDEVVIRVFNNPDAMVAALKRGEIDFVQSVPEGQFLNLKKDDQFATIEGSQGGFDEFALNGGDGLKKGHPALDDKRVREAIGHAIDKQTIVDRVARGLATPAEAISPSANPAWTPEIPEDQRYDFDLDKANQILDDAGYEDTDGDGVREMPGGGEPLRMRYAVRTESAVAQPIAEFITGWLEGDRDRHDAEALRRRPAHRGHRQGRLRHVRLGLDAVRRPRADAQLLHLRPGRQRPGRPDELLQRREPLRRGVRQALRAAEGRAGPGQADGHRPPDADPVLLERGLLPALLPGRPAGVPQGPLHGLAAPAGGDRAGAVLEHVAELHVAQAGLGDRGRGVGRR